MSGGSRSTHDEASTSNAVASSSGIPAAAATGSYEYVTAVDERLCCPICQAPMQDPWMSKTCEHFYCYECILQHLTSCDYDAGTCPCDRSPLRLDQDQASEKRQLVPAPRLVKLLCDELVVRCTSLSACKWTGQRSHWRRHFDNECNRLPEDACPNECGFKGQNLEEHQRNDCSRQPVVCRACRETVPKCELESHAQECPQAPVSCAECHEQGLPRSKLNIHIKDACPESLTECPHVRYGCHWKGKRKLLRHDHLDIECIFEPLKGVLDVHRERISTLESENSVLKRDLCNLRQVYEDLEQRVERLTVSVGINSTQDRLDQPISQQINALTSQMTDMTRASTRAHRASQQSLHDVKGEMSNMQMMLHDLRGELMALQHAQYYENAYRQWGRAGRGPTTQAGHKTTSNKDSEGSDSEGELATQGTQSTGRIGIPQFHGGYGPGYPFPPYPMAHPGQPGFVSTGPPYNAPPGPPFGLRRWSGWPYSFGASSPEDRGGGVKL